MRPNDKPAKRRKTRHAVPRIMAKTHPDNWPVQEVQTLEDLFADRAVTQNIRKDIRHADYR